MSAQVIETFVEPDVFRLVNLPDPRPSPDETLVAIAATSVNPVDHEIWRQGPSIAPRLPAILGCDVASTVLASGTNVTGYAFEDGVFGCVGRVASVSSGAHTERVAADIRLLARKPQNLSPNEAAALPPNTVITWDGLERTGAAAGMGVLVHGGAGGVGHVAAIDNTVPENGVHLRRSAFSARCAACRLRRGRQVHRRLGASFERVSTSH